MAADERRLEVCKSSRHLCNGVVVDVENVSEQHVVLRGLNAYGVAGPETRVFCMRKFSKNLKEQSDWRSYFECYHHSGSVDELDLSLKTETELRFDTPIILRPYGRAVLYVWTGPHRSEVNTDYDYVGFTYKRFASISKISNEHLVTHRAMGCYGRPFEMFRISRDGSWVEGVNMVPATFLCGSIIYQLATEAEAEQFQLRMDGTFFTLADYWDASYEVVGIGETNRYLIDEWNGIPREKARQRVYLPGEQRPRWASQRRRSSITTGLLSLEPGWKPSLEELDALWDRSIACRELWCRCAKGWRPRRRGDTPPSPSPASLSVGPVRLARTVLSRSGRGRGEAWLAHVRAGIQAVCACRMRATRLKQLDRLLESFPPLPVGLHRWQQVRISLVGRGLLRRAKLLLERARADCREAAMAGSHAIDPFGQLEALNGLVNQYLISRQRAFRSSPEYWACTRLWAATPKPVTMADFTLIRRYGKGAYGQVFAARKEDTMALFALKCMPIQHANERRGRHHLRMERQVLERVAATGSPFLCSLRYAFITGPWLVLALPLLTGGTLQLHIDERALDCGLPLAELRWIAAQLTLGLEAMHGLGLLHRDVKPSNIIMDRHGYLVLSDFGLSGTIGANSRSGTRGYWSPETVRKEAQRETSDWWCLGVTLWYTACGRQPFHRRARTIDGQLVWPPLISKSTGRAVSGGGVVLGQAEEGDDGHHHRRSPPAETRTDSLQLDPPAPAAEVPVDGRGASAAGGEADGHPCEWKRRVSISDLSDHGGVDAGAAAGALRDGDEGGEAEQADAIGVGEAATGAVGGTRRGRLTEAELNHNTLHMPIDVAERRKCPELASFLRRLLERDPAQRLGAGGAHELKSHPFLDGHTEWDLMQTRQVLAPWTPESCTVYTRDVIEEFSGDKDEPSKESRDYFANWDYAGDAKDYVEELVQFVQKSATRAVLRSLSAPETELAKLGEALRRVDGSQETHSSDTRSETGSLGTRGTRDDLEYDSEDDMAADDD